MTLQRGLHDSSVPDRSAGIIDVEGGSSLFIVA